jgi:hypothetical protein
LNKAVTVSSVDYTGNAGSNAVDGSTATRWSSAYSDPQWIMVDLGSNYNISEIDLNWQTACGYNYLIQTSTDDVTWTTQTTVTGNTTVGLVQYPYSTQPTARYVRMYGTQRATAWGYSLWEISVYGTATTTSTTPATTGFAAWQAQYFTTAELADPTISGATADPYGSGVPNLLAYALRLNPATARPSDVPHAKVVGGHLALMYLAPAAIKDITWVVEVSSDLQTWNSGPGYTQVTSNMSGSAGNVITVQDILTGRQFMRLRVTQNP